MSLHSQGKIMNPYKIALFSLALSMTPMVSSAQSTYDMGKMIYLDNCATCHGMAGKGDGPLRSFLTKTPSDLTMITKRNQGTFPQQRLWEVIDGRGMGESGVHGSREMPVWGQEFKTQAVRESGRFSTEGWPYGVMPYGGMHRGTGPEWHVYQKISALIDYLARIQVN